MKGGKLEIILCKNVVYTFILQNKEHTLYHQLLCDTVFPREIRGSGNYGLQEGSVLIITSSDPCGKIVLLIPTVL